MGINIRTNIESINAQRRLSEATGGLRTAYARLSSGLRITTAADDAAGLSIAESLKADSRIAQVSIRNANDGISIIAITDGAMDQMTSVLTRMAELSDQSANGVYSTNQRSALQLEFRALGSELQRIAETTTFNGLNLLSGSSQVTLQVGFTGVSNSQITYSGVDATLQSMGLGDGTIGGYAMTYSINDTTVAAAQISARSSLDAIRAAITSITTSRGKLGAAEARLNVSITNLMVARENFSAAESRIRDVDVAAEAAELTRLNVLQQAAAAVLSQANQQPQIALSLLQN